MLQSFFREKAANANHGWQTALWSATPIIIWANVSILAFTLLLYFSGIYFGDANPFQLDYYWHVEWTIVGYMAAFGVHLGKKYALRKSSSPLWPLTLGVVLASTLGGMLLDVFYQFIGPLVGVHFNVSITYYDIKFPAFVTNTLTYLFWGIMLCIPVAIHHNAKYKHKLENKLKELEKEKLEQLKDKAVLDALRARINPHFLYNSLNSIASLVKSQPEKAEEMVLNLSELFRLSIKDDADHFTSIAEELDTIRLYLSIEKIRFGEKLTYAIEVQPDCLDQKIPRFLLQPLVENAVKHGTSKVSEGKLAVEIYNENSDLVMNVSDNGPAFLPQPQSGYGMLGVQEKLDLLFPNQYVFDWTNEPNKKVTVRLMNKGNE